MDTHSAEPRHSNGESCSGNYQNMQRLANGLGWFSIGLGLAEVLAPRSVARLTGLENDDDDYTLLRTFGLREIAAGIGILSNQRPTDWMWGRVAGDVMDLAYLGSAMSSENANKMRIATAAAAVLGVTALDVLCGQELSRKSTKPLKMGSRQVKKSTTINCAPEEAYSYWRDFENLPSFMSNLESVSVIDDRRSHWKAKAPADSSVEWDAEIVNDIPNRLIAWRALENADVYNAGSVRFDPAPGNRGTIVHVRLHYDPPGGAIGAAIAKVFGKEPGQEIDHDLRCFKQMIECGEIIKSDASVHTGMHPARPDEGVSSNDAPNWSYQQYDERSPSYAG